MTLADVTQVVLVVISLGVAVALIMSVIVSNRKSSAQLEMIAGLTYQTHVLVNKRYGEALMAQILLARTVARLTIEPDDQQAADDIVIAAEQAYQEHQSKQMLLDAMEQDTSSTSKG